MVIKGITSVPGDTFEISGCKAFSETNHASAVLLCKVV
jgi:hypothetical protein